jgi:hypothetical protein
MGSANIARSETAPFRIEPAFGKAPENNVESSSGELGNVLQVDVAGSNLAKDAEDLEPEAGALTVDAGATSGQGDVLAGEAGNDKIHDATPRSAVEGFEIVPDREMR